MKVFLGIDPGQKGSLCALSSEGDILFQDFTDDIPVLVKWLENLRTAHDITMCLLEDVHSIFGVSAKSNFNFGKNLGLVEGTVRALSLPLDRVTPKEWQKVVGVKYVPKSTSTQKKKVGASLARQLYPDCDIYGPNGGVIDGRSDALLIAHYARLKYGGMHES